MGRPIEVDDGVWTPMATDATASNAFYPDVNRGRPVVGLTAEFVGQYQSIVFIEGDVPDAHRLASGTTPGTLSIILNPDDDGLRQISAFLARYEVRNLAAMDIVAHGSDGLVQPGTARLSSASVSHYQSELAMMGAILRPGGAIQLYGCDVAQQADGVAFLDQLSDATGGANIAAATHPVGATVDGGSWMFRPAGASTGAPFTAAAEGSFSAELVAPSTHTLFTAFNNGAGHPNSFTTDIRTEAMQVA